MQQKPIYYSLPFCELISFELGLIARRRQEEKISKGKIEKYGLQVIVETKSRVVDD